MSTARDTDQLFRAWMDEGPAVLRDDVLASVATGIHGAPQRMVAGRRWRRLPAAVRFGTVALAAAVVVAIGAVSFGWWTGIGTGPSVGGLGPAASPSPSPSSSPDRSPGRSPITSYSMDSRVYPYTLELPAEIVSIRPSPASVAWDGEIRCVAGENPCADVVGLTGEPTAYDRTLWVFGTPTELSLEAFAAHVQQKTSTWKECPAEPSSVRDLVLDGAPARLHAFTCTFDGGADLHLRLFAIHDGFGLVVGQAKLASGEPLVEAEEVDRLLEALSTFRWGP